MIKTTKQPSKNLKPGMLVPFASSDISMVLSVKKHDSLFHIKVLANNLKIYNWYAGVSETSVLIYE